MLPTSVTLVPGALPTDPVVATVVFNNGHSMRGGNYKVIVDSGPDDFGLQDIAGNPLDGNFYGIFPSGDGLPGGDFVATIATFHNLVLPAVPIKDGYVPPSLAPKVTVAPAVKHSAVTAFSAPAQLSRLHHDLAIEALSHQHIRALKRHK